MGLPSACRTLRKRVRKIQDTSEWFHESYVIDWAVAWAVFLLTYLICEAVIMPRCRIYLESNSMLSYPLEKDIVPGWALLFVVVVFPAMVVCSFLIGQQSWRHEAHSAALSIAEALAVVGLMTEPTNVLVGRLRPHWLALVQTTGYGPEDYSALCHTRAVRQGRLSFPSGHSSFSCVAGVFCSLYLAGKLGVFKQGGHGRHGLLPGLVVLLPMVGALFVAISRARDYHHNFTDIMTGCVIGLLAGTIGYRLNFPSPSSPLAGQPYNRKKLRMEQEPTSFQPVECDDDLSRDPLVAMATSNV